MKISPMGGHKRGYTPTWVIRGIKPLGWGIWLGGHWSAIPRKATFFLAFDPKEICRAITDQARCPAPSVSQKLAVITFSHRWTDVDLDWPFRWSRQPRLHGQCHRRISFPPFTFVPALVSNEMPNNYRLWRLPCSIVFSDACGYRRHLTLLHKR